MKEILGNLWDYYGKFPQYAIAITTNGFVKNSGECVMGRGCALEACQKLTYLPLKLGNLIRTNGNHVFRLGAGLYSFPVKHNWWEKADIELIKRSCLEISTIAKEDKIIIPRMGCGNGGLNWETVKNYSEFLLDDRFYIITFKKGGK